tara:strand:- start:489 stop:941 length:453 start_codon:yes stop_codon:yes gene_type:complete
MEIEKVIYELSKEQYETFIIPFNLFDTMKKEKEIVIGKQYPRLKDSDKRGKLAFAELLKKLKLNKDVFNILKYETNYQYNDNNFNIILKRTNLNLKNYFSSSKENIICKKKELTVDEKLNDLIKNLSNEELVNINIKINQLIIMNIQLGV